MAVGFKVNLVISLNVINPINLKSSPTTGNFSILFSCRISSACAKSVPCFAVTKFSDVITSVIALSLSFSKRKSRLVTIPFNTLFSSTTGIPPMLYSFIARFASPTLAVNGKVTGSIIIPLSERLTLRTSAACCSIVMFLCKTPIPPSRAIAIAISLSVTVSIAAEIIGTFNVILRENFDFILTSRGRI